MLYANPNPNPKTICIVPDYTNVINENDHEV